jgi:hypothetical protein
MEVRGERAVERWTRWRRVRVTRRFQADRSPDRPRKARWAAKGSRASLRCPYQAYDWKKLGSGVVSSASHVNMDYNMRTRSKVLRFLSDLAAAVRGNGPVTF